MACRRPTMMSCQRRGATQRGDRRCGAYLLTTVARSSALYCAPYRGRARRCGAERRTAGLRGLGRQAHVHTILWHDHMARLMVAINLLSSVATTEQRLNFLERICNNVDGPADRVDNQLRHYTNLSSAPLILQFGVMGGRTLRAISKAAAAKLPKTTTEQATIWGFDSFTGLPDEARGNYAAADWNRGAFSATARTNNFSLQHSRIESVMARIKARTFGDVHLIPGFYDHSLTRDLGKQISRSGPATYIDVDCDLYLSSFQALDWAFANGLVGVGTMIGYDDWWVLPCTAPKSQDIEQFGGEARAHFEIARKYSVTFECVCGPCTSTANFTNGWRTYFIVRSLSAADAGFSMDAAAVQSFLSTNQACVHHNRRRRAHLA